MARRPTLRRAEFVDSETYAMALKAAGGPGYDEVDALIHLPGEAGKMMRAVWGGSQADFDAAVEAEHRTKVRRSPQKFVAKYEAPRGRRGASRAH